MPTLLSTKRLSTAQKQLILNSGLGFVEYEAIKIDFVDFEAASVENAIITSKNAAKAVIKNNISIAKCFCVGEKTSEVLKNHNYKVAEVQDYGRNLANIVLNSYSDQSFTFFCGNKRRDEIPSVLKENNIAFEEIEVYKTRLNFQHFQQNFDGILFFSPSGVQSFTKENQLKDSVVFCIGTTTASEAKKHTENVIIATKPSIENLIVQAVKYFRN
ncbi:uroporphyrinogen-III synthase [Salegentibacter sp. F188]|uniref:Uroporphyrinogen-III synthase n=1 Tax=Autumnicola patrickiae TaxID=3075591 RepID=A0ABU3E183_9FLAO|nr:uroporphyrinogen-III synthase [Salegentibacter sp. F188]MDT0689680.1 uroporphyrinogen-III synthase [Salegentibacter sp. F188]